MNNTAHCFLSYPAEDLLLGNFIGDFVKGKSWEQYAGDVQKGILLHRTIDSFTDNHPATHQSVVLIRPFAGRYAPPVLDVLYDHLLCINWREITDIDFDAFASWTYESLQKRVLEMPPVLQKRLPQMVDGQFLHRYQTREGLEWVLEQFARRLVGNVDLVAMSDFFFTNIDLFSENFLTFFPDLQARVQRQRAGD